MLSSPNNPFLSGKLRFFLILFIVADLGISFNQYYNSPIDGDVTSIVLPTAKYKAVLKDPCGIEMIASDTTYSEPNRFFALALIYEYFRTVPLISQSFLSPISSVYFSAAFLKIFIQILIVVMIGLYSSGRIGFKNDLFITSIALATIFFQVGGYSSTMGIIDATVSYTVYYSLSVGLVLILLYPLIMNFGFKREIKPGVFSILFYFMLAIIIPFMGNQVPLLIISIFLTALAGSMIFKVELSKIVAVIKADKKYLSVLILFIFLCSYSYFMSLYNSERNLSGLSFIERIAKIPAGLKNILFGKPGLWILMVLITINSIILKKISPAFNLKFLKWFGLFCVMYLLVLPLDGYYEFRPNIIRRDNFIPVILILIVIFSRTTLSLIDALSNSPAKIRYMGFYIFTIMLIFTLADLPSLRIENCQRASLEMLSISDKKIVHLSGKCNLASWYSAKEVKDSEVNAQVFYLWGITAEPKYYIQH